MDCTNVLRRVLLGLILGALLLPIVICVITGVGALLGAMGDAAGGTVLLRIALGLGILWLITLICLLLVQTLYAILRSDGPDESAH